MNGISIDENDEQEIKDNLGSTKAYSGTATTTPANVPSSAGNIISGALVENLGAVDLQASFDGGTTYFIIQKKTNLSWNVKGEITQIKIKTAADTTDYQVLINFEET